MFANLESHIHAWLLRLSRHGPVMISLVLAALIAAEVANVGLTLWAGNRAAAASAPAPGAPLSRRLSGVDVQTIAAAHLFGVAKRSVPTQDPSEARPTTAPIVLEGTIATDDPQRGVAIISDGARQTVYAVGDSVGGAALHSVYLDYVILDRAGSLERLRLPALVPSLRPIMARVAPKDTRNDIGEAIVAMEAQHQTLVKMQLAAEAVSEPKPWDRNGSTAPASQVMPLDRPPANASSED